MSVFDQLSDLLRMEKELMVPVSEHKTLLFHALREDGKDFFPDGLSLDRIEIHEFNKDSYNLYINKKSYYVEPEVNVSQSNESLHHRIQVIFDQINQRCSQYYFYYCTVSENDLMMRIVFKAYRYVSI